MSNYIRHIIYLTPSQIKSFGKRLVITQDYSSLKNKEKSKTQFKKTLDHVMRLNNNKKLKKKKEENRKNLQLLLKNIKEKIRKNKIKLIKLNFIFCLKIK